MEMKKATKGHRKKNLHINTYTGTGNATILNQSIDNSLILTTATGTGFDQGNKNVDRTIAGADASKTKGA